MPIDIGCEDWRIYFAVPVILLSISD